jgi:hypothetical protein
LQIPLKVIGIRVIHLNFSMKYKISKLYHSRYHLVSNFFGGNCQKCVTVKTHDFKTHFLSKPRQIRKQ